MVAPLVTAAGGAAVKVATKAIPFLARTGSNAVKGGGTVATRGGGTVVKGGSSPLSPRQFPSAINATKGKNGVYDITGKATKSGGTGNIFSRVAGNKYLNGMGMGSALTSAFDGDDGNESSSSDGSNVDPVGPRANTGSFAKLG